MILEGLRPILIGTVLTIIIMTVVFGSINTEQLTVVQGSLTGSFSSIIGLILGYAINYFVWLR